MKIAFTAKGIAWDSPIDPRFGRAEYILIYDAEIDELSHFNNRTITNQAHGAGPKTAQKLFELKATVLITGSGPGGNAAAVLDKFDLKIFTGAADMTIKQAFKAYKENKLEEFISNNI